MKEGLNIKEKMKRVRRKIVGFGKFSTPYRKHDVTSIFEERERSKDTGSSIKAFSSKKLQLLYIKIIAFFTAPKKKLRDFFYQ